MNTATMKTGLDDWFALGKTRADAEALIVDTLPGSADDWEQPIPLALDVGPKLPMKCLPPVMRNLAAGIADQLQAPLELPFGVEMATVSVATAGKFTVLYEPTEWRVPTNTYTLSVSEPGSNKSATFARVTHPLTAWETEKIEAATIRLEEWESKERALIKRLNSAENAEGKPSKDGKITDAEALRKLALEELKEHRARKLVVPDLFGDDATSEAIKERMSEQGGVYGSLSAESSILSILMKGRYSKGEPTLDVVLNGHPGDMVKVSRVGKTTVIIPHAYLTLGLMVQPEVIRQLGDVPGIITRGVAARFLPLFPVDTVGTRDRTRHTTIPAGVAEAWNKAIVRLLDMPRGATPVDLPLTREAEGMVTAYLQYLEPRIPAEGAAMQGFLAKLAETALRIAGQFHAVQHPEPQKIPISAETIHNAITMAGYFHEHARIMFRMIAGGGQADARDALAVLHDLADALPDGESITRRILHRKLMGRTVFRRADSLSSPLAVLEEFGWIRRRRDPAQKHGAPSEIIEVNPYRQSDSIDRNAPESPFRQFRQSVNTVQPVSATIRPFPDLTGDSLLPTGTESPNAEEI